MPQPYAWPHLLALGLVPPAFAVTTAPGCSHENQRDLCTRCPRWRILHGHVQYTCAMCVPPRARGLCPKHPWQRKHGCPACRSTPVAAVALLAQERALNQCDHSLVGATSGEVDPTPLLSLAIDTSGFDFPTCVLAGCGRPKRRSAHLVRKFLVCMLYVMETVPKKTKNRDLQRFHRDIVEFC